MSFPAYPDYKDSGVDWLGEAPSHWDVGSFRRLINSVSNGTTADQVDETEATIAVSRIETISTGEINFEKVGYVDRAGVAVRFLLNNGDILFSHINSLAMVGNVALYRGGRPLLHGMNLLRIQPRADVASDWVFYWLKSNNIRQEVESRAKPAINQASISTDSVRAIPALIPPKNEQIQIACFLDHETVRIDALIKEQQRLIELIKEKRQALISLAVTKGLDPTVPMKDSGVEWLGDVPAHWQAVRLRHCLIDALTYGANESSDDANPEHPRYIRITDLNDDGTLSAETYKSLPPGTAEPYMLEHGDVLFARSGATVGKSFLYSQECGPACYAGYLIRARVDKRALVPMYLWMCTQSRQYEQFIGENNIQATIQNVSAEKYGNMWIALPAIEEQEAILAALKIQLSKFKDLRMV